MGRIVSLSEQVISKIAAGEVIERPAYIVKELIENAIDAKATHIQIAVEQYGMEKIIVTDNGGGMDSDDILMCFKPHTTSKITTDEDLLTVKSLGFRGEALASIAAIGSVIIRSRTHESRYGNEVFVQNGKLEKTSRKGMPIGTQIVVSQAFSQVPVRKKFLQSPQAEYRFMLEVIYRFIITFPEITFDITHNGERVLTFPSVPEWKTRAEFVIPSDIMQQLFPITFDQEYVGITGYISPPQVNYKSQRNIQFFVNKRFIRDPRLTSIIKNTYGSLLEPAAYPYILLFISIPHHLIDVNVHPRKESIHMMEHIKVFEALEKAIGSTLQTHNLSFFDKRWQYGEKADASFSVRDGGTTTYAASVLRQKVTPADRERKPIQVSEIVQVHNTYLIIPTAKGVLLIDQHAAHERVLFERFQQAFLEEKSKAESIILKDKIVFDCTKPEQEVLLDFKNIVEKLGFIFEQKKGGFYITHVPVLFKDRDIKQLLRDILDDLFSRDELSDYDVFSNTMLEYLSCRSAIKAGDVITKQRAKELIEELNQTKNPYTCPHGRPIQVEMEKDYLDKLFKRK